MDVLRGWWWWLGDMEVRECVYEYLFIQCDLNSQLPMRIIFHMLDEFVEEYRNVPWATR